MIKRMMLLLTWLLIASPMLFAQTSPSQGSGSVQWVLVAAAFAMAIASGLCGLAQGKAVVGAAESMARNPGAATAIRFAMLVGLVLIESMALYTLVICFIVIFTKA
jgi:F-type H+-transporting ATPase subunit c